MLVCITSQNRIYKLEMYSHLEAKTALTIECVQSYHYSAIHSISTCELKPIMLTCDENLVCLWNYVERRVEMCKSFVDKVYSACLHPYGLHLALVFFDKINFYSILRNELSLTRTFDLS